MEKKYSNLFTPFKIGKLEIKNRFCLAPMGFIPITAMGTFSDDGVEYLVERAKGGFGLITVGCICSDTKVDPLDPLLMLSPLTSPGNFIRNGVFMNERIHSYGAKTICQITMGMGRNYPGLKSPSAVPTFYGNQTAPVLTTEEIKQKIQAMIDAAVVVKAANYDALEVHSIHWGYLLDQFAMSITNQRTDEYGGSLENRLRAAREILEGIKDACGSDFPVSIRVGLKSYIKGLGEGQSSLDGKQEAGRTLEEGLEICQLLESYGYDALSVDVGVYESFYHACPPMYMPKGQVLPLSAKAKEVVDIPILTSNRMNDPELCEKAIAEGQTDAVVLGRASLADPYFPQKVEIGKPETIRPCLSCNQGCITRGFESGTACCAVNPTAFRTRTYGVDKAPTSKKIAIIGGGVAGMEAARVATFRGHEVTVYEASDRLGGNLNPAGTHKFKEDVKLLNEWYQRELKEMDIPVQLNTRLDAEDIKKLDVDAVILAVGSVPIIPCLAGMEKAVACLDAISCAKAVGEKVVVVGGGLVGCEMALEYAMEGKTVTIVEALDSILASGGAVPIQVSMMLKDLLAEYKVDVRAGCRIEEVKDKGAAICAADGTKSLIEADTVVLSIGFRPLPSMRADLLGSGIPVYEIGDGRKVGNIMTAIWDAYEIARGI